MAPAPRYRVLQYLPYLEACGVQCEVRALHGESYPPWSRWPVVGNLYKAAVRSRRWFQVSDAHTFDAVFLQRLTLPFSSFIERRLIRRSSKVIFDYDDALFQTPDGPDPTRFKVFRDVVDGVHRVVAGSQYLADKARQDAQVIPTVIDTETYLPVARAGEELVIGWMGTHSNYPNFPAILPQLEQILTRFPHVSLHIVSDVPPPFSLPRLHFTRWRKENEIADLQRFHIGIMPLLDTDWNRGKCAFKLIEYMSVGIPVVAGSVGANREVVLEGETGYLAERPEQWGEALERLIGDEDLRRKMGETGRDRCVAHYSLLSQRERLLAVLRETAAGK